MGTGRAFHLGVLKNREVLPMNTLSETYTCLCGMVIMCLEYLGTMEKCGFESKDDLLRFLRLSYVATKNWTRDTSFYSLQLIDFNH